MREQGKGKPFEDGMVLQVLPLREQQGEGLVRRMVFRPAGVPWGRSSGGRWILLVQ